MIVSSCSEKFNIIKRNRKCWFDFLRKIIGLYFENSSLASDLDSLLAYKTFQFQYINFRVRNQQFLTAIIALLIFYNSKILNCFGALSFFLRSVHTFSLFLESNWSGDFDHAETRSGVKKRVVLRRELFALILT